MVFKFYKALFCNQELEEKFPKANNCLEIIFNKIQEESFPKDQNSVSIVSIPQKNDLSNYNNHKNISLINVDLTIIIKKTTDKILNILMLIILLGLSNLVFAIMKLAFIFP